MGNTQAIKMTDGMHRQPALRQDLYSRSNTMRTTTGAAFSGNRLQTTGMAKKPGGLDLTGATELEFWVRGAEGGETVSFVLGVVDGDVPYRDTAKGELNNVRLTTQWQKLRIPLDGRDLSRIKTGFGWSLAGQGKPVVFYLDDIRYVGP